MQMTLQQLNTPMRVAAVLFLMASGTAAMAQAIESGDVSLHARGNAGPAMHFAGIPLIRGTSLQAYRPDWSDGYYTSAGGGKRAAHIDRQSRQITVEHATSDRINFTATETYRLVQENRIEISLKATMDSQVPANLEWAIGMVEAFGLYGGSYAGEGATPRAVVPVQMRNEPDPVVLRDQREVRLRSRAGQVIVRVEQGDARLALLDGRLGATRWWTLESPSFWLGFLAVPLPPGKEVELRVSIEFIPQNTAPAAPPATRAAPVKQLPVVFSPQPRPIVIVPKPRRLEWRQGRFSVTSATPLAIASDTARRAARVVQREVHERFGWDWEIIAAAESLPDAVYFDIKPDLAPEAYEIDVHDDHVTLYASTAAGHFYAAQTLVQMLQADADGVFLPAAVIRDEPSLAFRGVHVFPGRDAMPFHTRLVERIFARYKLNHIVLQSDYTQWETDEKIWIDISVPKDQLRQYVDLARENFLEPIPLVMSLGHAEWMFKNDQNLDLAEDPEAKYAYSVTNPATYDFILSIYREAMEIFGPKYFHIGHDEVTMRGRYPHREEAKKWGVTKLFLYDIHKLREFFQPQNVRMLLWGDMLLAREETYDTAAFAESVEEAKRRRDELPRDAIICDWHYQPTAPQNYTSLKLFQEAGFTTIACTWYQPMNIYTFAQAARMHDAWGLLQTTWAGYSITEKAMHDDLKQFTAYILAAEYAWSGDSPPPDELPYRAEDLFMAAMNPQPEPTAVRAGFHADLSALANMPLRGDDAWLGYGSAADFRTLPIDQRLNGFSFHAADSAVALHGRLLPQNTTRPASVTIELNQRAAELAFLHVSAFPAPMRAPIGEYRITYDDGSHETIPLRYGVNIRAWTDTAATTEARIGFAARTTSGLDTAARILLWNNPHPDKTIRAIRFSTAHPYASPILLGLAGLAQQ